jgi:hypothetical protein
LLVLVVDAAPTEINVSSVTQAIRRMMLTIPTDRDRLVQSL